MKRYVYKMNVQKIFIAVTIVCCLLFTYLVVGTSIKTASYSTEAQTLQARVVKLMSRSLQQEAHHSRTDAVMETRGMVPHQNLADVDKRYQYIVYSAMIIDMLAIATLLQILSQVRRSMRAERRQNRSQQAISIVMEYIHKMDGEWGTTNFAIHFK